MSRPNLLVVMADDHAQWATSCYGNREVRTPTLDYLATTGVRFANAYTTTPVCSPARATFYTGKLPSQHGIHDYINEFLYDGDWLAGETTLAETLNAARYQTGLIGKWHAGNSHVPQPGFEYWLSYAHGQWPHRGDIQLNENGRHFVHRGHQSPYFTAKAVDFLRTRDRERPFFLFVGYVDTHSPFRGHPERLVGPYRRCDFRDIPWETSASDRGWTRWGIPEEDGERLEWLAQYYAAVTMLDEQVAVLVDELEGGGHGDTLVIYTSDHGHMNGHHGLYAAGNSTVPQNFYEEAIRVPLLIQWPSRVGSGMVDERPVDHCDLFQTVLDAAGVAGDRPGADARDYPGRSILPSSGSAPSTWRDTQFGEYGNARMIRTHRFKLVRHYAPHAGVYPDELYDLANDPREADNRIADPTLGPLVSKLDSALEAHFTQYEDPSRSAKAIEDQPVVNGREPWRLERPATIPPEGAHLEMIRHLDDPPDGP